MCMETAVYHGAELHPSHDRRASCMEWPLKTRVWASALHGHWGRHLSDRTVANHQPGGDSEWNSMRRTLAGPVMGELRPSGPLQAHPQHTAPSSRRRVPQPTHGPNRRKRYPRWPDRDWACPAACINRHDTYTRTRKCRRRTYYSDSTYWVPTGVFPENSHLPLGHGIATAWCVSLWSTIAAPTAVGECRTGTTAEPWSSRSTAQCHLSIWSLCWLSCHSVAHRRCSNFAVQRPKCYPEILTVGPMCGG